MLQLQFINSEYKAMKNLLALNDVDPHFHEVTICCRQALIASQFFTRAAIEQNSSICDMKPEIDYVLNGEPLKLEKVAGLEFPKGSLEAQHCRGIRKVLQDYASREGNSKPLSIAIFGPPGSGKSRCVRMIAKDLGEKYGILHVVNLSQLSRCEDIVVRLRNSLGNDSLDYFSKKPKIPIIFFDEFDTPLGDRSLGWLRWFLALMQDGEYMDGARSIKVGKAVLVFAGGTAASLKEFEERAKLDSVAYREKKVPDFISRLRSFIDVKGINEQDPRENRPVRRALLLRNLLLRRWFKEESTKTKLNIKPEIVESLISNVHFIHGARSMEALVEMSTQNKNGEIRIPNIDLTRLHVGRGALDGKLIGISAGLEADKSGDLLKQITETLLLDGAQLAYGGDFQPNGTLHKIVEAAAKIPSDFFQRKDKLILNYLGFPSSLRKEVVEAKKKYKDKIDFIELGTLFDQELDDLNLKKDVWFPARPVSDLEAYQSNHHLAWSISLFRMRVRLIQDIDALIVFGGKDGNSWGRFSGIAEEVMLAIAYRKPVYVLGGFGGAAREVGKLLGLDHTIANPDECLEDEKPIEDICPPKFERAFALVNPDLPGTIKELRNYLFSHSANDAEKWPWNGLSPQDNRELFREEISLPEGASDETRRKVQAARTRCVDAIVKGLSRLEWKRPALP